MDIWCFLSTKKPCALAVNLQAAVKIAVSVQSMLKNPDIRSAELSMSGYRVFHPVVKVVEGFQWHPPVKTLSVFL